MILSLFFQTAPSRRNWRVAYRHPSSALELDDPVGLRRRFSRPRVLAKISSDPLRYCVANTQCPILGLHSQKTGRNQRYVLCFRSQGLWNKIKLEHTSLRKARQESNTNSLNDPPNATVTLTIIQQLYVDKMRKNRRSRL